MRPLDLPTFSRAWRWIQTYGIGANVDRNIWLYICLDVDFLYQFEYLDLY